MWVSKKYYEFLRESSDRYVESIIEKKTPLSSNLYEKIDKLYIKLAQDYNLKCNANIKLKEQVESLEEKLEEYKQLYLNEMQKRLELAEIVRKMNGD